MKAITISMLLLTGIVSNMCFANEFEIILVENFSHFAFEKDTIWCSSFSGVLEYDTITKEKRYYTVADGLLDNQCHCVAVDTEGIKWFGTASGISSFDGSNWTSYSREEQSKWGHCGNIAIDSNNDIWFVSNNGVSRKSESGWTFWKEDFNNIFIDHNDTKWFAGGGVGAKFNGQDIVEIYNWENENYEFSYEIVAIDNNNVQFWSDDSGLRIIDGDEVSTVDISASSFALDSFNTLWIGDVNKLWKYENGEFTIAVNLRDYGLNTWVTDIEIDEDGAVWIAVSGHIAKYTPDRSTSVQSTQPQILSIIKTYPNPFNAETTLAFELPSDSVTRLAVYDSMGRKVRELLNGDMRAGQHSVLWDGRDANGVSVGSGVYFSRLNAGEMSANGRMLFVK